MIPVASLYIRCHTPDTLPGFGIFMDSDSDSVVRNSAILCAFRASVPKSSRELHPRTPRLGTRHDGTFTTALQPSEPPRYATPTVHRASTTTMASAKELAAFAVAHGDAADVTVNQRALIDKMLARYCSDNVVIRELSQNADDSGATAVALEFTTSAAPAPKTKKNRGHKGGHTSWCSQLDVVNNGREFRGEDWARLVRIAEGNCNTDTVGMFGVGFYSTFSLSEEPLVKSGAKHLVSGTACGVVARGQSADGAVPAATRCSSGVGTT